MKLQRQLAYKYKDTKHYKWVVVIPENVLNQLGWKAGEDLKPIIDEDKLIIKLNDEKEVMKKAKVEDK